MEIKLDNINYENKLRNINYIFKESSITSIIGSSGAGKSLLGLILMNIIKNYEGKIIVDGSDNYDIYNYLSKVGYVSYNPEKHFICETVKDEIAFSLKQNNYKIDQIDKQVLDSLKIVGLSIDIMNKNVLYLSASEKVKVAIASVLAMNPDVLILDEVTIYLDGKSKMELLNLLLRLKDKFNKTIIVISNDMDFVYGLGNDYVLMDKGRIIKSDKVDKMVISGKLFDKYGLQVPKILKFINMVSLRKGKRLKNIKNIDDIIKEVTIENG